MEQLNTEQVKETVKKIKPKKDPYADKKDESQITQGQQDLFGDILGD